MEKATWEEIKALASDFKRTQATSLSQKLTERNCIDIINYLCSTKQISLYFTTDGKVFLTPQELEKEIYEELEISNDRIELTKLCTSLDLDLHTIDNVVNKMINNDDNLQIVMGSLINSSYVRRVALKINEMIKDKGKSTILELTEQFNLPKVFMENLVNNNLQSIIEAHKDGEMLYTNNFIRRHTAMLRGYLTRSSKPVSIVQLSQKFSISEKLIIRIISDLIDHQRIIGKFELHKSVFLPDIHLTHQKSYLHCFFDRNNYLDFATMKEIGIVNPSKLIESEFPGIVTLSNCALGHGIISQFEEAIIDCDSNSTVFDCFSILPITVTRDDLQRLIDKSIEDPGKLMIIAESFVVSRLFIGKCVTFFDDIINSKAAEFAAKNQKKSMGTIFTESSFADSLAAEEASSKGGEKLMKFKSGGGLRGREVKVKSVKNKYMTDKRAAPSHTQSTNRKPTTQLGHDFITETEAIDILQQKLESDELPQLFLQELFQLIDRQLTWQFKSRCELSMQQMGDSSAKSKATDHQKFEAEISMKINKIKIFDKSLSEIDSLDSDSLRLDLRKSLVKTVGGDLVNMVCEHVAVAIDSPWRFESDRLTNEARARLIGEITNPDLAVAMKSIVRSLKSVGDSLDEFHRAVDAVCARLDICPRKLDRKAEKSLVQEIAAQYQSIVTAKCGGTETDDTSGTIEPGELLLVAVVLIFQRLTGQPLHATGRFVPGILEFLRLKASTSVVHGNATGGIDWEALKQYQDYVIASIKMQTSSPDEVNSFKEAHTELHAKVIDIVLNWKNLKI